MGNFTLCLAAAILARTSVVQPAATTISIVAAENVYGDVAQQLAGPDATVTSIMSNPDQDPHLFEASAAVARGLSAAAIVVYNGDDYDPWMAKLLTASRSAGRKVIVIANLVHRKAGENPHLWYDPATMPVYAKALATALAERDPNHKPDYDRRLQAFLESLQPLDGKIVELRTRYDWHTGYCHGAGVRLYGCSTRAEDAQRAFSASGDEQHRAAAFGRCRLRE